MVWRLFQRTARPTGAPAAVTAPAPSPRLPDLMGARCLRCPELDGFSWADAVTTLEKVRATVPDAIWMAPFGDRLLIRPSAKTIDRIAVQEQAREVRAWLEKHPSLFAGLEPTLVRSFTKDASWMGPGYTLREVAGFASLSHELGMATLCWRAHQGGVLAMPLGDALSIDALGRVNYRCPQELRTEKQRLDAFLAETR